MVEWFTQQEILQGCGWQAEGRLRTRGEELSCVWYGKGEIIDRGAQGLALEGCHIGTFHFSRNHPSRIKQLETSPT